jgi:DNA mismatch endonuclease (patch repair protein)
MSGNRSSDTSPEKVLRQALWRLGLRYRLHAKELPGKPDVVFRRQRVAVFCDGDFWHGKDWGERRRRLSEGANADYWVPKIEANMARDLRHTAALEALGWRVVRLWESEINADPAVAADRVQQALVGYSPTTAQNTRPISCSDLT